MAIACGNTFVLKPSEKDPSCSMRLAELLKDSGLPDGVFNVVNGAKTIVESLCDHPDIKALAFVGSSSVAKIVYTRCSQNSKRSICLGGAKNHMIVVPDADKDSTAKGLLASSMGSAGQIAGILPDQVPTEGVSGENVEFMGNLCFTGTLSSNIIRRTGALAVFGFAQRISDGFQIRYLPASDKIYSEDISESLAALNTGVEKCISYCPEQYQWEYKRFRTHPRELSQVYKN